MPLAVSGARVDAGGRQSRGAEAYWATFAHHRRRVALGGVVAVVVVVLVVVVAYSATGGSSPPWDAEPPSDIIEFTVLAHISQISRVGAS